MKKKLIIIVIIISLFLIALSAYTLKKDTDVKEHYFEYAEIKNFKTDDETEINDKEVYKDNIIIDNKVSIDYSFIHSEESITGTIYIGSDKHLYITNFNKSTAHRVSTDKFKTLYVKDYEYKNGIYVYLISEDNIVYIMSLTGNDITKTDIFAYRTGVKFTNFVDIDLKHDKFQPGNSMFVMTETGNIYDINTGLRYDENTISLYNNIYVYSNKTMTNVYGHKIEDKDGNQYKIKYIFYEYESNKFIDENRIVIITEDDKFIYFDKDLMNVYEFDKKVKDVKFDKYYPYVKGNLEVTFEDGYKVNFNASCNQYYCVNEFAE